MNEAKTTDPVIAKIRVDADKRNAEINARLEGIARRVLERSLAADGKITITTYALRLAMREALDAGREMGAARMAEIIRGDW